MDKVFKDLIDNTIDVYVDDMVVKSQRAEDHTSALAKVFDNRLKPREMILWSHDQQFPRVHGHAKRDRGQPR